MQSWQEDNTQAILSATSEGEIFSATRKCAEKLGFDYCAYGARVALPVSHPKVVMYNNYSTAWQETYAKEGFLSIDPTVAHGSSSTLPVLWSDELFAGAGRLWDAARSHGLTQGWAQPCLAPGGVRGLLTLARGGEEISAQELAANQTQMSWLAHVTHDGMARLLRKTYANASLTEPLTERELEVLRWTADGKTAEDVAEILNISERTITFHLGKCVEKLQVNNKLAATVRAAMMGLL
jgi:LuxR family transcriptional regulator, quorum-sensing system regulator SolR